MLDLAGGHRHELTENMRSDPGIFDFVKWLQVGEPDAPALEQAKARARELSPSQGGPRRPWSSAGASRATSSDLLEVACPVDGSVLRMDSKRLQDLGATHVTLDEVYGILVVIYAWKFTPREGLASIPENDHDGELLENMDDTCSESTMTGGNVSECTDELTYIF